MDKHIKVMGMDVAQRESKTFWKEDRTCLNDPPYTTKNPK